MRLKFKTKIGTLTAEILYNKQEFKYVAYFIEKPEFEAKGTAIEEVLDLLNTNLENNLNLI
mgnify:CR=1 FL=1